MVIVKRLIDVSLHRWKRGGSSGQMRRKRRGRTVRTLGKYAAKDFEGRTMKIMDVSHDGGTHYAKRAGKTREGFE
ncbi:hypothetical protein DPMN_065392 [Dreissena polymorpha]|uniref:Uncharacterized protein n=1 Tax=Dreissena polymorpha TaxID=45954 RepID=A0A9D3YRL4_DREPO|nr:hypothetical protein DPMN_065392 [Dreissena polymorpha]